MLFKVHPNFDITNDRVMLLLFTISRNSLYRDFLIVKGAGICSLYHEIHYIEIRYIEVWVYIYQDTMKSQVWLMRDSNWTEVYAYHRSFLFQLMKGDMGSYQLCKPFSYNSVSSHSLFYRLQLLYAHSNFAVRQYILRYVRNGWIGAGKIELFSIYWISIIQYPYHFNHIPSIFNA